MVILQFINQEVYNLIFLLEMALYIRTIVVGYNDLKVFQLMVVGQRSVIVYECYGRVLIGHFHANTVQREYANGLYFSIIRRFKFVQEIVDFYGTRGKKFIPNKL